MNYDTCFPALKGCDTCDVTAVLMCHCPRCRREPPDERFFTCIEHAVFVAQRHQRIRGREAEWGPLP